MVRRTHFVQGRRLLTLWCATAKRKCDVSPVQEADQGWSGCVPPLRRGPGAEENAMEAHR